MTAIFSSKYLDVLLLTFTWGVAISIDKERNKRGIVTGWSILILVGPIAINFKF